MVHVEVQHGHPLERPALPTVHAARVGGTDGHGVEEAEAVGAGGRVGEEEAGRHGAARAGVVPGGARRHEDVRVVATGSTVHRLRQGGREAGRSANATTDGHKKEAKGGRCVGV